MQGEVEFPDEFDMLDIVAHELIQPVARKRVGIEKARDERRKVRKPTGGSPRSDTEANANAPGGGDVGACGRTFCRR